MRIKPMTVAAVVVSATALLLATGALDKLFLRATGTVVRREVPRT